LRWDIITCFNVLVDVYLPPSVSFFCVIFFNEKKERSESNRKYATNVPLSLDTFYMASFLSISFSNERTHVRLNLEQTYVLTNNRKVTGSSCSRSAAYGGAADTLPPTPAKAATSVIAAGAVPCEDFVEMKFQFNSHGGCGQGSRGGGGDGSIGDGGGVQSSSLAQGR